MNIELLVICAVVIAVAIAVVTVVLVAYEVFKDRPTRLNENAR